MNNWLKSFVIFIAFFQTVVLDAEPFPIQFAIPEVKVVQEVPEKDRDFAFIIPGDLSTYIYQSEEDYYKGYQRAFFGVTRRKAGWDCMRHYEILANGCIPYFLDLDQCDDRTMSFLPRELIKEAMNLEGVSYLHIDHEKFDRKKYDEILRKLLAHTQEHLTTRQMARYVLKTIQYSGQGKILYLSTDTRADYLRCLMLIGLKELLADRIVDVPKIDHIYTNYCGDVKALAGQGMSFTRIVPEIPVDRSNIEQRITNKEFDLIIYGAIHRGLPFFELVQNVYEPEKIVYFCGEDWHFCPFTAFTNLFLREFENYIDLPSWFQPRG